ncbi:MAG: hypothetical protein JWL59_4852 [Chthoniobacteraceae bacterium]|nr:hypothetical protein [Chthoniobacteraceae bacterium]
MKIRIILIACVPVLLTACAGMSPTRIAADGLGAAGGALIGGVLGKNNPHITAAGAGAGVLLGETIAAGSAKAAEKSYATGYEKGRSDSAKDQFRQLVELQRQPGNIDSGLSLFDIPLPEREVNGALLNASVKTLRIQE